MGDLAYYFQTRYRTPEAPGREDFLHASGRDEAACYRRWRAAGHDPMRVAAEQTHDLGLEFHACHRLGGFHLPPPHDYFDHGDTLYARHQEWRGRDRAGSPSPVLSFSYPQVRGHVVEMFREMTAYGIDGICLLFNRRHPIVEYEPPLIDGFREQHGTDPRDLAPDDPAWLRYRAGVLTGFLRELRAALDLPITAIVMSGEAENLANGLDPAAWLAAGLVDTLVPFTDLPELNMTAHPLARPARAGAVRPSHRGERLPAGSLHRPRRHGSRGAAPHRPPAWPRQGAGRAVLLERHGRAADPLRPGVDRGA